MFRNFYNYLRDNQRTLKISKEQLLLLKDTKKFTSAEKLKEIYRKIENFKDLYEMYMNSRAFKDFMKSLTIKYDDQYLKLMFRHSKEFINLFLYRE